MQGMSGSTFDGELRRRQSLPENLATEDLRAADVAAVTAEYVVFNALERELPNQVFEDGTHRAGNTLA